MKRRLLSAFLAVMMVLTMAPVAFAADTETTTEYVAQVDGNKYETLADAIKAANDGDTITLLKGGNGNGFKVPEGKFTEQGLTIDFNQFTYMIGGQLVGSAGTGTNGCQLLKNNKITFKNGSFVGATEGSKPADDTPDWHGAPAIMIQNYCDLTLENMIVTGGDETVYTFSNNCGNTVIKDSTINAGKAKGYGSGPFAFDVCRYSTYPSVSVTVQGSSVINGDVEISGTIGEGQSRQLNIEDGTFNGRFIVSNTPANISITGGKFSSDVSAYVAEGYVQNENGTVEQLGETNAVAKIDDTYYKTLADAVAAAQGGATVKLLKDVTEDVVIPADKTITLDLNGKKLTNKTGHTITVEQGATLTINGKGTVDNVTHQKTTIYNKGTVTLNGGTYDRSKEDGIGGSNTYYTLLNHGTMTVANVTVNNEGGYSSLFENGYFDYSKSRDGIDNPTLTIESGTFTGGINTVKNDDGATMTINGGIFTNYAQSAFQNHNIATINGGTFNGATVYAILNCGTGCKSDAAPDLHQLTITDGNFNGKIYKGGDSKDGTHYDIGSISITGGYFTTDPSAYVASDYVAGTSDVSGYSYKVVAKTNTGSVEVKPDVADPEVKVDKIPQKDQETVKAAAETVFAPTLGAAAVDEAQKINEDKANELLKDVNVGDGVKKLYVQSSLKVEPTAYDETTKTLALEITPQYRVVASTADTADKIKLDGDTKNAQVVQDYQTMNITKATVVTMELPTGFAVADGDKLSIQHTKNGTVEYYTGTVTEQSGKHLLTFTTNGFSPFVISVPAASIGENVYPTLQAAVDSVKSGKTIKLEQNVAVNTKATVAKTIKFEVATNEKTFAKENIVAGANTTVKVTGDVSPYTYEFTYTKPSSGGSSSGKTTYKVTTSAVNNGGVNASPSTAEKGATITLTLSPDKGYKLDKLTVTDGSGKTVSTVKKSDTVYTFTMPASAVTVGVSYAKADETPSKTTFNDVSANDWFASAVDYVTGKGMMNGTADNTFSPKANTTRGMVVTVLYRLENQPSTSAASFTDVASGAYYANAVAWANANGIVSGYGSGKFGPNDKVTREQLAAILYRYAQYKKYDVSVGEDTNILSYNDAQSISSYAIPAIQWACGAGVVTGKSGSKLDPKGNATRAEVAAMLMRFCENVK